ncbi:hypothetical protein Gpo141_00009192 [Globisporangium polare]
MAFARKLGAHIGNSGIAVYHDQTMVSIYLSHTSKSTRAGDERRQTEDNDNSLYTQAASRAGPASCLTREVAVSVEEHTRFVADLFASAVNSQEYQELIVRKKVMIVTDCAAEHGEVGEQAQQE